MLQTYELHNGLRIIHQPSTENAAYCGLIINIGTRDEQEDEVGMAHFLEHVIFKGTQKRRAYHILSRLEDVGGDLNAYTSKEDTCIYATFLAKDYERTLELFADIVFNSIFPEKEIEKEKEVVIDEINSYKDAPSELIFDDFEELIYKNAPIGRNILGTEESVRSFTREQILKFVRRNYHPENMVLSSVGNIDFERLIHFAEKYFNDIPRGESAIKRIPTGVYQPQKQEIYKNTHQVHCVIGNVAYSFKKEERFTLSMLVDLLGGATMNSRLNLNIRERYGLAYNIEAAYTPYSDTGVFTIYFGCDPEDWERCAHLCRHEMNVLCNEPLGQGQLRKMKNQQIGKLLLSADNSENTMLTNGKSLLVFNRVETIEEVCNRVDAVDAQSLQEIAQDVFAPEKQTFLIYK